MAREEMPPAVERQYEDPHPVEQRMWNQSIYGMVILLALVFLVVIIAAVLIF